MATKKKAYLVREGSQWYIVDGKKKIDVGRSKSYAEKLLAEHNAK
jgi:hypothetical protein